MDKRIGKVHFGHVGGFDDVPDYHVLCGLDYVESERLTTNQLNVTCKTCLKVSCSHASKKEQPNG